MRARASADGVLRIAHHHPGRLRVRADAFLDGGPAAERTKADLMRTPGVRTVSHDPRIGSLLVEYQPHDVDVNKLVTRIAELGGLVLPKSPRGQPLTVGPVEGGSMAARRIIEVVQKLDAVAVNATKGRFDLGVLIPGGLTALGVYSFFRGPHARMPRWDSLVYWAYSVFARAHARGAQPVP